jgi:prepilin-type N-terminal cleavage/methylation domain-containing protein
VRQRGSERGFSVVELIVVMALSAIAILGLAAIFDSSTKINKSGAESAELQQSLRAALDEVQRSVRMAGVGGLSVDRSIALTEPGGQSHNNTAGLTLMDRFGVIHPVRPGTDMLEVRGVIRTPLFALSAGGCGTCLGSPDSVTIPATTLFSVSNDADSAFSALGAALAASPRMFVVSSTTGNVTSGGTFYNVGWTPRLAGPPGWTTAATVSVDFQDANAAALDNPAPIPLDGAVRAGILDDLVYFVDDTDPNHPALAVAELRSLAPRRFDVSPLAEDIEDLQVAYGVDANGDNRVGDAVGTAAGDDEWFPNVAGEAVPALVGATGPRLHAILVGLVAKASQPDKRYEKRPSALARRLLDSTAAAVPSPRAFHRESVFLRVNLRNFRYQGT